ncbi:hypothetical protein GCM10029976_079940 [Kribbella albertanoniae]
MLPTPAKSTIKAKNATKLPGTIGLRTDGRLGMRRIDLFCPSLSPSCITVALPGEGWGYGDDG